MTLPLIALCAQLHCADPGVAATDSDGGTAPGMDAATDSGGPDGGPLAEPVRGYADLHLHMFAEKAHGGAWLWGEAAHPDETWALRRCSGNLDLRPDHAATRFGVLNELVSSNGVTDGDAGLHAGKRRGYDRRTGPGLPEAHYEHWPSWDTIAHQQVFGGALKRAHEQGLTLMVMSAVDFRAFCEIMVPENRKPSLLRNGKCDEYTSIMAQLDAAIAFAKAHDWVEIATDPAQARRIIRDGKLAMVLSIEAEEPFSGQQDFTAILDEYYAKGLRHMQIGAHINNSLTGVAPIEAFHPFMWLENAFRKGECVTINGGRRCNYDDLTAVDMVTIMRVSPKSGFTCRDAAGKTGDCNADRGYLNELGLTAAGKKLVAAMMQRGMLIDMAHLSKRATGDLIELSMAHGAYPLHSSHSHLRAMLVKEGANMTDRRQEKPLDEVQLAAIRLTGGIVGIRPGPDETMAYAPSGVANSCPGSSRSLAQSIAWGADLGVRLAFGSDLNGFIQQALSRAGNEACRKRPPGTPERYDFRPPGPEAEDGMQRFAYPSAEERAFYGRQGFAHVGLLRTLFEDLRAVGLKQKYLNNLASSAEAFVQMWEAAVAKAR